MAVFPDRIVLKNSADSEAEIIAAIETGGDDEITQGELVIGLNAGGTKFYTKDANGNIVSLGGAGTGAQYINDLLDVDTSTNPPVIDQALTWDGVNWVPSSISATSATFAGLGDVNTTDAATISVFSIDPLPSYTGGRVVFQPNGNSVYPFAGLSSWDNGTVNLVGGTGSEARASITLASNQTVSFLPNPQGNSSQNKKQYFRSL